EEQDGPGVPAHGEAEPAPGGDGEADPGLSPPGGVRRRRGHRQLHGRTGGRHDPRDQAPAADLRGADGRLRAGAEGAERMSLAFLYAGQGTQHPGMGADLYEAYPAFRAVVDSAGVDFDLKTTMFSDPDGVLNQTEYTQPCMV